MKNLYTAKDWRERAEKAGAIAEQAVDPETKRAALEMAVGYETLAESAAYVCRLIALQLPPGSRVRAALLARSRAAAPESFTRVDHLAELYGLTRARDEPDQKLARRVSHAIVTKIRSKARSV
jgi:hypothetical protein